MKFKNFDRTELLKKEIFKYLKVVITFCEDRNLPKNFVEFLNYKTNDTQYLPDCYKYLPDCPMILLNSSKAYKKFYYSLDADFQHDIHKPNSKTLFIPANKEIVEFVKKILKKDFILN